MNNLKAFFTFLGRNKLYTFINIFGLSISLMFVILIANYVVQNLTIDSHVKNADRIYALATEDFIGSGGRNGELLAARYPEIEMSCSLTGGDKLTVNMNNTEYSAITLFADTTFFDMFSIKLEEGDPRTVLIEKNNIVISRSFAGKIFGTLNPLGQTVPIYMRDTLMNFTVAGIAQDLKNSILPEFEIITQFKNVGYVNSSITSEHQNNAGSVAVFLMEKPGTDLRAKTEDILAYFKTYFWPYAQGAWQSVNLLPLKEIYFSDLQAEVLAHGEKSFVIILISIGLLILLFSVVNYINLTVAQTGFRAKEMATRRLLGSSREAIFIKLIIESLFLCTVAFIIGFFLAITFEPYANTLLSSKISITGDLTVAYAASYVSLIILVSVLSGIVPAWIISKYQPIEVVRGTFRRRASMIYGKFLITFQNIITIALVAGSLTMFLQVNHLINAPMGYNTKNIIDISTWSGFKNYNQIRTAVNDLRQLPFVEDISLCCGTPLSGGNNNTIPYGKERMVSFQTFIADSNFFNILGLKLKSDNNLTESGYYFNEYAFKEMELSESEPVIKMGSNYDQEYKVAGVYYDFRVRNALREPTAALIINLKNFEDFNKERVQRYPWDILVKIKEGTNQDDAYKAVKEVAVNAAQGSEIKMDYIESQIKETYSEQHRTSNIVLIFTFIAVLISSLGLLAMSTYFIQQRQMEIAVRKIFGSTDKEMLLRLISNFMKLVGIAFVISIPIIWFTMDWWLEHYTYKIQLSPFIFVGAAIFSSFIAFITVYWQSRNAATANPVDAVKK